jgi:hypothetical protein
MKFEDPRGVPARELRVGDYIVDLVTNSAGRIVRIEYERIKPLRYYGYIFTLMPKRTHIAVPPDTIMPLVLSAREAFSFGGAL